MRFERLWIGSTVADHHIFGIWLAGDHNRAQVDEAGLFVGADPADVADRGIDHSGSGGGIAEDDVFHERGEDERADAATDTGGIADEDVQPGRAFASIHSLSVLWIVA